MSYIKLHRDIIESYCFSDSNALKVWIWLLLKANYKKSFLTIKSGRGQTTIELNRGQLIFGRNRAESELGIHSSSIYRIMQKFQDLEQIIIEPNSHYSVITICKYDDYQGDSEQDEQHLNSIRTANEQHSNSIRTAFEQHLNTYKEELEEKEIKEIINKPNGNFDSNGTWEDEKKYFKIDEAWQMKICTSNRLKKDELISRMDDFLKMIELQEDFKSAKELKRHFVNWLNKKQKLELPEQNKTQTLRKLPESPNSVK